MVSLYVVKFGGSVITKKGENKFEMNYAVLERLAFEIKNACSKKKFKLILVCGVGPFGHLNVVKYKINDSVRSEEQILGVKKTNLDCDFVGKEVSKALEKAGIKTVCVPAYNVCEQRNKKVEKFDFKPYEKALEEGKVPISTGIMVKDSELNWSVISGDQIIAQLAKHFKPKKVLLGTDVDGIFTADPKEDPSAELIPKITKKNIGKILEQVGESKSVDVTQGMKGKLEKLAATLHGTPAEIFNLFVEGNLEKALEGKKIKGTKILL